MNFAMNLHKFDLDTNFISIIIDISLNFFNQSSRRFFRETYNFEKNDTSCIDN